MYCMVQNVSVCTYKELIGGNGSLIIIPTCRIIALSRYTGIVLVYVHILPCMFQTEAQVLLHDGAIALPTGPADMRNANSLM